MKKIILILIFLSANLNAQDKPDLEIPETNKMLKESLALSLHFKEFAKSQSGVSFFTVGADAVCQYSSVQAAIDDYFQSPLANIDIRIATNKTYIENIVIGNANIALTGGYSNCTNANNGIVSSGQSLINANFNGTVLKIQGVTTRRTMVFKNLRLFNGSNATGAGGGFLSDNSNVSLLLENVDIRNNSAQFGAGLAIVGGDTDLLMNESLILSNVADYGGGVYCSGFSSSINVANQSGIIANFANSPLVVAPNGRGAGAYIEGCYFAIFTGSHNNGSFSGMESNTSENDGGAIYAENSIIRLHGHQSCGSLGCLGDDTNPVSLRSNQSNFGDGAVIYAKNSDVRVNAAWIEGNVGNSLIFLEQSNYVFERFLQPCWSNEDCNLIENNIGTVMAGFSNTKIEISSVNITGNNTMVFDFNVGNPVTPTLIRVESCMINNNGGNGNDYLFNFVGFFDAQFVHNTIADNQAANSIFKTDFNPNISIPPLLEIQSTIIHNPLIDVYSFDELDFIIGGGQMHINVSACFVNEVDSLTSNLLINDAIIYPEGERNSMLDPSFVDRNNGDYHLSSGSFAIDHIRTTDRTTVLHPDIDFQARGFNAPNVSGVPLFYYDIGADEVVNKPEIMFVDSFE
jgi:hypothetical protein